MKKPEKRETHNLPYLCICVQSVVQYVTLCMHMLHMYNIIYVYGLGCG